MKKLLFILMLMWPVLLLAQEPVPFADWTLTTESNLADQVVVVQGDTTVRMTLQTLFELIQQGTLDNTSANTDTVDEKTTDHGILLDRKVLIKDGYLRLDQITAPSAPAAGYALLYVNSSDGHVYLRTNTELFDLTEGTGGGATPDSSAYAYTHLPVTSVSHEEGRTFYDSDDGYLKLSDGSNWYILNPPRMNVDTVAWMLVDTITFPFGLGAGNPNDTATFHDEAFMGGWYNEQDSLISCKVIGNCKGTGADVDVRIVYDVTKWDATPTVIWSGTITTSGGQVVSTAFTTKKIPPNVHIWGEVDGEPTEAATLLTLDYEFSKKRAQ